MKEDPDESALIAEFVQLITIIMEIHVRLFPIIAFYIVLITVIAEKTAS